MPSSMREAVRRSTAALPRPPRCQPGSTCKAHAQAWGQPAKHMSKLGSIYFQIVVSSWLVQAAAACRDQPVTPQHPEGVSDCLRGPGVYRAWRQADSVPRPCTAVQGQAAGPNQCCSEQAAAACSGFEVDTSLLRCPCCPWAGLHCQSVSHRQQQTKFVWVCGQADPLASSGCTGSCCTATHSLEGSLLSRLPSWWGSCQATLLTVR